MNMDFDQKTALERILLGAVSALSAVAIALIIFIAVTLSYGTEVCNTPSCVQAANHIIGMIDESVDPCDDFYDFVCGSFVKKSFALGQKTVIEELQDRLQSSLKEIVVEKETDYNISTTLEYQRQFYKSCIDLNAIEADENKTFLKLLDKLMGGWHVAKNSAWPERDFEWSNVMLKARELGLFYQLFFRVEVFNLEMEKTVPWVKPLLENDVSKFYWSIQTVKQIEDIAEILGYQKGTNTAADHLGKTVEFSNALNEIVQKHHKNISIEGTETIRNVTIRNLKHKFIKINWYQFLRRMTRVDLQYTDIVVFDVEKYFDDLYYLILRTPKKVQSTYVAWAIIVKNIDYLTKNIRDKFDKILLSANENSWLSKKKDERENFCYSKSRNLFKNVAEGEYIRRYTPEYKRVPIIEIIKAVKTEMQEVISKNSWMQPEHKKFAETQLSAITEYVGWIDLVYNVKLFECFFGYDKLNSSADDDLLKITQEINFVNANTFYEKLTLNNSVDYNAIFTPKIDVNAYFAQDVDMLFLPTSIVQPPIFDETRPNYMNYGAVGSIVGHELTHGFTRILPEDVKNNPKFDWVTNQIRKAFTNAIQCIVEEYNEYPIRMKKYNTNGSDFEENLADFTGVNLAYVSYQNWVDENSKEQKLPGLKYTPNQIFWIMASTFQCQKPDLGNENREINNDTVEEAKDIHGVPNFRVVGTFRNSPYFGKDWNCPVGSKMNPEKKCRVFN